MWISTKSVADRRWSLGAIICASMFASLFINPAPLQAQFTAVIEGRVADPSDAGVPNAEVTIERSELGIKRLVRASDVGYYRVASLPPGQFSVRVSAPGFDSVVIDSVQLENDQVKTLNIQLKIGAPTTQVSVTAEV